MKIPKFWARVSGVEVDGPSARPMWAWGWSDKSLEEARENALARAKRLLAFLGSDDAMLGRPHEYGYDACPLREEILETVKDEHGAVIAMVTRNRYGALVLNAANVCFIDVDDPEPSMAGLGFFARLKMMFSGSAYSEAKEALKARTLERIKSWAAQNPKRTFRLYRTAAGLRVVFTDGLYDPTSREVSTLFEAFGSDPLYRSLTRKQECFRARLTAKPWRCGVKPCGVFYPFVDEAGGEDGARRAAYEKWVTEYEKTATGYAVCRLVERFGGRESEKEEVVRILGMHDGYCVKSPQTPLA